jgi:hypothetical protein
VDRYAHRWRKIISTRNEETWEAKPYDVQVVDSPEPDMTEARQQLRHAREQIALTRQYPRRQT